MQGVAAFQQATSFEGGQVLNEGARRSSKANNPPLCLPQHVISCVCCHWCPGRALSLAFCVGMSMLKSGMMGVFPAPETIAEMKSKLA